MAAGYGFVEDTLRDESTLFVAHCASDGKVKSNWVFNSAPHSVNVTRAAYDDGGPLLTGQTGNLHRKLMVLQY